MTPDDLKAKAKELKHTTSGRVLFEYLHVVLADVTTQMVAAREPVDMFRLQGRAQQLDDLIKLVTPEKM